MSIITDIKAGITGLTATYLGAEFKALEYVEDIAANNFRQISKGYAVRDIDGVETEGVNRSVTMNHNFEIAISDQYVQTSVNDSKLVLVKNDLLSKGLDLYKIMINEKAGAPSVVMNVLGLQLPEYELDDEAKVIVQRIRFNIIYRFGL